MRNTYHGLIGRAVPGLEQFLDYRDEWLRFDLAVGVSVAAVAIPKYDRCSYWTSGLTNAGFVYHLRSQARAASRSLALKWRNSALTKCLAICGAIERTALSETAAILVMSR